MRARCIALHPLYFNDFNNARSYNLSYILAILIIHERIHSSLSALCRPVYIRVNIDGPFFLSPPSPSSSPRPLLTPATPLADPRNVPRLEDRN